MPVTICPCTVAVLTTTLGPPAPVPVGCDPAGGGVAVGAFEGFVAFLPFGGAFEGFVAFLPFGGAFAGG